MYATLSEITLQYGTTEIAQLLDDEDGNISPELLTAALNNEDLSSYTPDEISSINRALNRAEQIITQQAHFIDASVGRRYPVPLSDSNARATPVQVCCMALVRAALADDGDNISEQVAKDRDYWRGWLRDIATDKAVLPGLTVISSGNGSEQQCITQQPKSRINWSDY